MVQREESHNGVFTRVSQMLWLSCPPPYAPVLCVREQGILVSLTLFYFTPYDDPQFHPFSYQCHNVILHKISHYHSARVWGLGTPAMA